MFLCNLEEPGNLLQFAGSAQQINEAGQRWVVVWGKRSNEFIRASWFLGFPLRFLWVYGGKADGLGDEWHTWFLLQKLLEVKYSLFIVLLPEHEVCHHLTTNTEKRLSSNAKTTKTIKKFENDKRAVGEYDCFSVKITKVILVFFFFYYSSLEADLKSLFKHQFLYRENK